MSMRSAYESVLCGKMHYDRTRRYGFTEMGGNMNNAEKSEQRCRADYARGYSRSEAKKKNKKT